MVSTFMAGVSLLRDADQLYRNCHNWFEVLSNVWKHLQVTRLVNKNSLLIYVCFRVLVVATFFGLEMWYNSFQLYKTVIFNTIPIRHAYVINNFITTSRRETTTGHVLATRLHMILIVAKHEIWSVQPIRLRRRISLPVNIISNIEETNCCFAKS